MQGRKTLQCQGKTYTVVDVESISCWSRLPLCMQVLLENAIRNEPGRYNTHIEAFEKWLEGEAREVFFYPSRVLMQDLTGVPALVDLAAMRVATQDLGGKAASINPQCPVDLVIDHSVSVDFAKNPDAFADNVALEVKRNKERYGFLKWAQGAFDNVRIVPPGKGICHQVNLEYLATVVSEKDGLLYPDTLVGLDSHTTMINGLGVLAWGVGGIEAEAAMLGQPISLNLPDVIGVELKGEVGPGITATDVVLFLTKKLREYGVVGKFVEFFGEGVKALSLAERATISNMSPEFGATCALFPIDEETLSYLNLTGRDTEHIERVRVYLEAMRMFGVSNRAEYTDVMVFDLSSVKSCIAGPKRPDQKRLLSEVKSSLGGVQSDRSQLSDASVVIAAITSCTNTSNPSVLIGAGLLARKAREKGLVLPKWVKPSFAPGSRVVMDYLEKLGLVEDLEALGFYLVGFGCTTCIGNSGPLDPEVAKKIEEKSLQAASVLSGNRNFEGRVHPQTVLNYLASPPLVVAYALAGTVAIDFEKESLQDGVFLKDIWPTEKEIQAALLSVSSDAFTKEYADIFEGEEDWRAISVIEGDQYAWDPKSTYIRLPEFFKGMSLEASKPKNIESARILAILGDNVTTDHISPASSIASDSAAAVYLRERGLSEDRFHSYGARRGNADVMVRGTFANIRLVNQMAVEKPGGYTRYYPGGEIIRIYDAAMRYREEGHDLVVFAANNYGMGSSRDWAAKGTRLLGVKAVIAKSFERIHRSNLLGMGVLPCIIEEDLALVGDEIIGIEGMMNMSEPKASLQLRVVSKGEDKIVPITAAIQTENELYYFQNGGILQYVLRQMLSSV